MQRPPPGVKLVIEAVCIMKGIKPKKVAGEKVCFLYKPTYYIGNKGIIGYNKGVMGNKDFSPMLSTNF